MGSTCTQGGGGGMGGGLEYVVAINKITCEIEECKPYILGHLVCLDFGVVGSRMKRK